MASTTVMKKLSLLLLSVLPFWSNLAAAECLLTFNTYGPIYASNVQGRSLRLVADIKKDNACDLIHFQEAWNTNQINIFELGLKSQYQVYSPNRQYRIGLMNFSKQPWSSAKVYTYRANFDGHLLDDLRKIVNAKKAFSVLEDALPGTFSVNTHLHPSSDQVRILQILDLLNWRVQHSSKPMILTGDFNSDPSSFEHTFAMKILNLDDAMLAVNGEYPKDFCSYCANNHLGWLNDDHTFDYVFFSHLGANENGWIPQDIHLALTGNGEPLSDHYGLKVNFNWGQGAVSQIDPEKSKQEMLELVDAATSRIISFSPAQKLGYITLIHRLRSDIQSGQGLYGEYFAQIFQKH